MDSYRMRMYKRRVWQQRATIVGVGVAIWSTIALAIILVTV